jgi:hypothetical protein
MGVGCEQSELAFAVHAPQRQVALLVAATLVGALTPQSALPAGRPLPLAPLHAINAATAAAATNPQDVLALLMVLVGQLFHVSQGRMY